MARSDFVARTKSILYGQGLGEKPSLRPLAAAANVSVSGSQVTFDLAAGEGAKVKAGHILSFISENDDTQAYVFYVTSMSTDQVTAFNGYHGAPAIANASADMNSGYLEHQPLRTEYEIHEAVDTVFDTLLWPNVWDFDTATVTPNMQHGQVDLPAAVQDIDTAWQVIANVAYTIPFAVYRNLHTTVTANGVLGAFDALDSSTVYYTYRSKLAIGDETGDEALVWMVATGAAALLLGASVSDTAQERSKKDSKNRQRDIAATLWRDFLTLRQQYGAEDSEDFTEILVERSY
jgi:hypothetical protein